jgi:hypothetical protein
LKIKFKYIIKEENDNASNLNEEKIKLMNNLFIFIFIFYLEIKFLII